MKVCAARICSRHAQRHRRQQAVDNGLDPSHSRARSRQASRGGTPTKEWLDPVFERVVGFQPSRDHGQKTKYDSLRDLIEALGGTYDPAIHSSEATDALSHRKTGNITLPGLVYIRDLLVVPGAFSAPTDSPDEFDVKSDSVEDARDQRLRRIAEVTYRPGAERFQRLTRALYRGRCAITGADASEALKRRTLCGIRGRRATYLKMRSCSGLMFIDSTIDIFLRLMMTTEWSCARSCAAPSMSRWRANQSRCPPIRSRGRQRTGSPSSVALPICSATSGHAGAISTDAASVGEAARTFSMSPRMCWRRM